MRFSVGFLIGVLLFLSGAIATPADAQGRLIPPNPPSNVSVKPAPTGGILTWVPDNMCSGTLDTFIGAAPSAGVGCSARSVQDKAVICTLRGLEPDTSYELWVATRSACGMSGNSARVTLRTPPATWTAIAGAQKPGAFASVDGAADGALWALLPNDTVWRWNGTAWMQFPGALRAISVGDQGNVWGVNRAGQVFKLNATGTGWDAPAVPPGTFVSVSIDERGTTLLVRNDGTVWKL